MRFTVAIPSLAAIAIAATSAAIQIDGVSSLTLTSSSPHGAHIAFVSTVRRARSARSARSAGDARNTKLQFGLEPCSTSRQRNTPRQRYHLSPNTPIAPLHANMDPYEMQYQQYFANNGNSNSDNQSNGNSNSNYDGGNADENPKARWKITSVTHSISHSTITGSAGSSTTGSYLQQLQLNHQQQEQEQYVSESPSESYPNYAEETSAQEVTISEINESYNEPAKAGAAGAIDPYEMQYRQYLQNLGEEMKTVETAPPSTPSTSATPMELTTSSTPPPATTPLSAETSTENSELSTELTESDLQEQFLKMVSNEVQYKKFINQSPYSVTDIKFPVLLQRFLDNLEDSTQKNNGKFKGQNKLGRKETPKDDRLTVVVLGTGWASHAFVKLASTYDLRIVVVSPVNHFVFTPMLASAAVGTVEYRSMTEPIRVTNPYIDNFVEGRAIGVDVVGKKVQVQLTGLTTVTGAFKGVASAAPDRLEPEPVLTHILYDEEGGMIKRDASFGAGGVIELNYDVLVCAVGTAARSSIVRGAKEHCFNLKTSQDSKRLRTAIGEALEYASRPDVQEYYYEEEEMKIWARDERRRRVTIAVVGGGPTGVELSGELKDFFAQVCRRPDGAYQHLKDDISVMLIHGGSDLLPAMDKELRERALEALEEQGVEVRLNTRLTEVGQDYITIGRKGSDYEETIPVGITVWAAGNAPVPFVKELLSQLPESAAGSAGRINVDQWLRCPTPTSESFGSIMVLGDVACFEAQEKYDDSPQPLPQTAQVAGQQGAFLARMLNRGYDMQTTPPKLPEYSESEAFSLLRTWLVARGLEEAPGFNFLSLGLLAYVGQEEALNQVELGKVPLFNYSGKIAFALWRSVYLAKQASTRNQALIAFDWLRTESFGRDITRL